MGEAIIAVLGLVLSIVSVIPIAVAIYYWLLRYSIGRSFLGFTTKGPIDFVLTTSAMHISPRKFGAVVKRPVTGIGQIQGTAFASKAIGDLYRRKGIRVHLSVDVHNTLDEDLLIIGGPAKNAVARQFLDCLPASPGGRRVVFDDIDGLIALPASDSQGQPTELRMNLDAIHGVPLEDWGVVILCRNPFSVLSRRAIFISGFTSYGTAATAEYFFGMILRQSWHSIRSANISRSAKNKGLFGFLVHIALSSGRPMAFSELRWFSYS